MSDIERAARDAVEAARNSEQLALITAVLQAQQLGQQQCQHPPVPRSSGSPAKWLALGAGGSVLAISFAVSVIAVAIGAVALTICVVVLRQVWQDAQTKGSR